MAPVAGSFQIADDVRDGLRSKVGCVRRDVACRVFNPDRPVPVIADGVVPAHARGAQDRRAMRAEQVGDFRRCIQVRKQRPELTNLQIANSERRVPQAHAETAVDLVSIPEEVELYKRSE